MKNIILGTSDIKASNIGLGCMRIADMEKNDVNRLLNVALDEGINFFDHADIYGKGKSEEIFSEAINMNSSIREKMIT